MHLAVNGHHIVGSPPSATPDVKKGGIWRGLEGWKGRRNSVPLAVLPLALVLLLAGACGGDDDDLSPSITPPPTPDVTPAPTEAPTAVPTPTPTPIPVYSGLLTVDTAELDFGMVYLEDSLEKSVTVGNDGDGSLSILVLLEEDDGVFSYQGVESFKLPAGEERELPFSFSPLREGSYQGRVEISSAFPFAEFTVLLVGESVQDTSFDEDGDLFSIDDGDCDDLDPEVYPGAQELCSGKDNNCDGVPAIEEPDWYRDYDGDGYGDSERTIPSCEPIPGYVFAAGDCDDDDESVYPGANEHCNGKDDDCDAAVDEGLPTSPYWLDFDLDGYGTTTSIQSCGALPGASSFTGDCNDEDDTAYPGADEICDGQDSDCDQAVDENGASLYHLDNDGDGHGDPDKTEVSCSLEGHSTLADDCNDSDASAYPGAEELCDGVDNDCNDEIDEGLTVTLYADVDGDLYGDPFAPKIACSVSAGYVLDNSDCDDDVSTVYPGAVETCNSVDDDCDATVDEGLYKSYYPDLDRDGYGDGSNVTTTCSSPGSSYLTTGGDCNDQEGTVHPGATETCNSRDDDCDGEVDELLRQAFYRDSDEDDHGDPLTVTQACSAPTGFVSASDDCDDTRDTVYPKAQEICDTLDNDCDTQVDEGVKSVFYADLDEDGHGTPLNSTAACEAPEGYASDSSDCDDSSNMIYPGAPELCDGKDNDCDKTIDEELATIFYFDFDQDGYGDPNSYTEACVPPSGQFVANFVDCDDKSAAINPLATEICNGLDDNCDDFTDDVDLDADSYRPLACGGDDCDDSSDLVNPTAEEVCDERDNDCDGTVDEGDPFVDFSSDSQHCGGCGNVCAEGRSCIRGGCGGLPIFQHKWRTATSISTSSGWVTLTNSSSSITTYGGPLEIELSIPMVGGSHSACRPTIDGQWAGKYAGLSETYGWHEGLDYTGYGGSYSRRMWKRTRVYTGISAGTHTLAAQCRTDSGTVTAGKAEVAALMITREYLGMNKAYQAVTLFGNIAPAQDAMVLVPGTELTVKTTGIPLEVTISLPIGNGGHGACLEWMDNAPMPSTPAYQNKRWYAGLEATYRGWAMWHHTRTYTGIPAGTHQFSVRCHNDSGNMRAGYSDMASVLIVRELDPIYYPSSQILDAYGNGWEISNGTANAWLTAGAYTRNLEVNSSSLEIDIHLDHYNVAVYNYLTCRPMIDGVWAGYYGGETFANNEEEGSSREVYEGTGWYGMWHRKRIYQGIPLGTHLFTLQCLSSGSNFYVGNNGHGSMLIREIDTLTSD